MSATERLRHLLDERGVKWSSIGGDTAWEDSRGWTATAEADSMDGSMVYITALVTPEQAIAATLGYESYGKVAEQGKCAKSNEQESYVMLKAENAKLREQLDVAEHNRTRNAREYARMCHENDKLRKLVARLMGHIKHPPCEGCSAECDCTDLTRCDEWSFMEADARKLGVDE